MVNEMTFAAKFQSPRSGKFVSDILKENDQDFEWYPVSIP